MKKIKYANLKKITVKTRLCFDCDNQYTPRLGDLPWLYCPYCGKKTYGFDKESLERFDNDYGDFDEYKDDVNIQHIEYVSHYLEFLTNRYLLKHK